MKQQPQALEDGKGISINLSGTITLEYWQVAMIALVSAIAGGILL